MPRNTGTSPGTRQLVLAASRGDRGAFAALHELYAAMVHGMLLARVPVQEADDLVQDVFLHALGKLRGLRDPDAFGPWLAVLTRNLAVQFHRRRRRTERLPDDIPARTAHEADTGEALRLLTAIRALPEAYRETLVLRLVEGLTGPQISACTGLEHGSVRVNLHRGMQLLREKLSMPEHAS